MANRKSIFVSIRNGFSYLDESESSKINNLRRKTLNLLKDYVYEGSYTKYKNKDLFLSLEPYDDKIISKKLSMSVEGVRQTRRRLSEEVYKLLGYDVVDRILYGDEHSCSLINDNLMLLNSLDAEFIISEIKDRINFSYIGDGSLSFDLRECKDEMTFLSLFTLSRFTDFVGKLDSEKLNYIIRLLDGKTDNSGDRFIALKYMSSDKSLDELFKLLKSSNVSNWVCFYYLILLLKNIDFTLVLWYNSI